MHKQVTATVSKSEYGRLLKKNGHLEEEILILKNKELLKELDKRSKDIRKGKYLTEKELWK